MQNNEVVRVVALTFYCIKHTWMESVHNIYNEKLIIIYITSVKIYHIFEKFIISERLMELS